MSSVFETVYCIHLMRNIPFRVKQNHMVYTCTSLQCIISTVINKSLLLSLSTCSNIRDEPEEVVHIVIVRKFHIAIVQKFAMPRLFNCLLNHLDCQLSLFSFWKLNIKNCVYLSNIFMYVRCLIPKLFFSLFLNSLKLWITETPVEY